MSQAVRVGVGCFVWKDGKFLMGLRKGSHGSDTWSIPGGHLEFSESWEDCAKREVFEETGMQITNIQFLTATNNLFEADGKHYVTIWVTSDWLSGEPTITEPDKYIEQTWRDFQSLPAPLFEPCWKDLRLMKPELFS